MFFVIFSIILKSWRFLDPGKRFLALFCSRYTYYQLCTILLAHFGYVPGGEAAGGVFATPSKSFCTYEF